MISHFDGSSSSTSHRTLVTPAERAATAKEEASRDADLVRRFVAGDQPAFTEIITRYRERMFSIAFALLKNHSDAEEVAQDTFIRAHRALGKFRGDSSLATWLHRIALNLSRNRYWHNFRRQRHASVPLDCAIGENNQTSFSDVVSSGAAGPDQELQTSEFSDNVAACLALMEDNPREILHLRNSKNRSYVEIGNELGINVGTVKSRLARARESLRALLAQVYVESGPNAQPADWFDPIRPSGDLMAVSA